MKYYLLFDSGCMDCIRIATEVEQATAGWLTARSLRDSAIQRLLNDVQPGWQWQPMLLEVIDDKPRVFAGIGMNVRLAAKLGLRRSVRLAKLVARTHQKPQVADLSRRQFLRQAGLSVGALTLLLRWPVTRVFAKESDRRSPATYGLHAAYQGPPGEFYEGFVLLPEVDTPIPDFVQRPEPHMRAENYNVRCGSLDELGALVPFPVYVLGEAHNGSQFIEGNVVISKKTQEIQYVDVVYGLLMDTENKWELKANVKARREYLRPFPVWPSRIIGEDSTTMPEKINFTPGPGIMLSNAVGHQLHWIQRGIAYSLLIEESLDRSALEQLARSLTPV